MRLLQRQKPPLGARIDWSHPLARGLVGCYLLNENIGTKVNDLSQRETGTISGPDCYWNNDALRFSLGDYVECGTTPYINQQFTIAFKMKMNSTPGNYPTFLSKRNTYATMEWELFYYISVGKISFWFGNSGANHIDFTGFTPQVGIKYSIVVRRHNDVFTEFVDGELRSTQTNSNPIPDTGTEKLRFGVLGGDSTTEYLDGWLWYVYIWNRALSEAEIKLLHKDPYCFITTPMKWYDVEVPTVSYASNTVADAYKILNFIEKLLSGEYKILNFTSNTETDTYKIFNFALQTVTDYYKILNFVEDVLGDAYKILNYASQAAADSYTIYNFASKLLEDIYSISGLITKAITDAYSILQYTSQTAADEYRILNFAQATAEDAYAIYIFAQKQIEDAYRILNYAGTGVEDAYKILEQVSKLLEDSYKLYNFAKQLVEDEYKIYNFASKTIQDAYTIGEIFAGKLYPILENLKALVLSLQNLKESNLEFENK